MRCLWKWPELAPPGTWLARRCRRNGSLDRVRERTSVHSFLFKDKKKHVRRDSFFHEELSDLFSKHLECDFIRNQKWNITMTIDIMSICTGCVLVFPWQYFDSYAACSTTPAHPPRQDVSFDLCSRPMAPSPWRGNTAVRGGHRARQALRCVGLWQRRQRRPKRVGQ